MRAAGIEEIEIVVNGGRPLRVSVRDRFFAEEVSLDDGLNTLRVGSVMRRVWLASASAKPPAGYRPIYGHFGLNDGCLECHETDDSGKLTLSGEREEICGWCHGDLSRGRRGVPWVSVHAPVQRRRVPRLPLPPPLREKGAPRRQAAGVRRLPRRRHRPAEDRPVRARPDEPRGLPPLPHGTLVGRAEAARPAGDRPVHRLPQRCAPPRGHPGRPAAPPDDPRGPVRPLPRAALVDEPAHAAPAGGAPLPGVPRGEDPQLPRSQGLFDLHLRQVPRSPPPDAAAPDHGRQPLALHHVPRFQRRGRVHPLLRRRGQVLPLPQLSRGVARARRRFALPRLPPGQPAAPGGARRDRERTLALHELPPAAPGAPRQAAARRGAHAVQGAILRGVPSRPRREDRAALRAPSASTATATRTPPRRQRRP